MTADPAATRSNNTSSSNGHNAVASAPAIVNMSTSALESKLVTLRNRSNTLSASVTQKLASSQSGQNLLHIGTSLSTLPPDLHTLVKDLHPVLTAAESTEQDLQSQLKQISEAGIEIRLQQRKNTKAAECAELYEDLVAAEGIVKEIVTTTEEDNGHDDILDHVLGLERAALTTACLVQDLEVSTERISALTVTTPSSKGDSSNKNIQSIRAPLPQDTEQAQFFMRLSPRIRSLEKQVIARLTSRLEWVLQQIQQQEEKEVQQQEGLLLMIGHCMRGLALLGRGKEVESVFARVAIMPLIRSKVSMGRLDEGGGRGECAGLWSLLDNVVCCISDKYGPVLRQTECMFDTEVDLVTAGVWVPIATAFMADPAIKMAIFSPGIASVLQANYSALDTFLSELAGRLLQEDVTDNASNEESKTTTTTLQDLYFKPTISSDTMQRAQERIYRHPMTAEFSKKWNLPIYYQLRFGESCSRLNKALDEVQQGGWETAVFTGSDAVAEAMKNEQGFELPVMMELYDTLQSLWRADVVLKPLTHRFLRGAVQMVGRMVVFCREGLENKIQFGIVENQDGGDGDDAMNGDSSSSAVIAPKPYHWGENLRDVAAVAWDLTVLETAMTHDYVDTVCKAVCDETDDSCSNDDIRLLVSQVLQEASEPIGPLVKTCWNEVICTLLTTKCCAPLAAVKGVGATYRMTNRPPPTQPSPFVAMILRPLVEFDSEFDTRTPPQVGEGWKLKIISTVSQRYSVAVEELFVTVQRTEVALKNRKSAARRTASGGMSDGEKVKLQLYLDYQQFAKNVQELGVDAESIEGVQKLKTLTVEAEGKRSAPNSLTGKI